MNDIEERKNRLNMTMGVPVTPVEVAWRMVDLGRQVGKTYMLVESLPEDGHAIVIVGNHSMALHIKDTIKRIWGPYYPIDKLHFVSLEQIRSGKHRLRGLRPMPVFVDNDVLDMLTIEYVKDWNAMFNPDSTKGRTEDEDKAYWNEVSGMGKGHPL